MKLIKGDCIEEMSNLITDSVDLVLTDPPYGTTACKWDSVIPFEPMWEQLNRLIKPKGAIVLFGSEPFSSVLRMSNIKNYKYDWIWAKNFSGGFALAKKRPMQYHEVISVFYNKQCNYYPTFEKYAKSIYERFKKDNGIKNNDKRIISGEVSDINKIKLVPRIIDKKRGKYPSSIKKFDSPPNASGRLHPTQKPVSLMEYLIKTYTLENETVLDFTMGSGTTGVACKKLGRNFIGIEKDPDYFKIAQDRIKKHCVQTSLI